MSSITNTILSIVALAGVLLSSSGLYCQNYKIVGSGQNKFFNNTKETTPPDSNSPFYWQDAHFNANPANYTDNQDGTISDNVTGLMWQSSPDANGNQDGIIEANDKLTWAGINAKIAEINANNYAGYDDWRIPTIKELYSLTYWNGTDPSGVQDNSTAGLTAFIDTNFFPFAYGQISAGERLIDVQYASSNIYTAPSAVGNQLLFGYNFADGRIKGYGMQLPGKGDKTFSLIAVRGNVDYGKNDFVENENNTVTDIATNLTWSKDDSKLGMNWEEALAYAQMKNLENYCGHNDWRVPNAKELQSIVDYSRSPAGTNSAAIDPIFNCSEIVNEAGTKDYPWFWTSTTHIGYNGTMYGASGAVYVCFGTAPGWMKIGQKTFYSYVDVHGAGAQRSSPKSGTNLGQLFGTDSLGNNVYGLGPQGDILRVNNYVRLVRNATTTTGIETDSQGELQLNQNYPNPFGNETNISFYLAESNNISVSIFNALGSKVYETDLGYLNAGNHRIRWNAAGEANGIYYYKIQSATTSQTKKMTLVR